MDHKSFNGSGFTRQKVTDQNEGIGESPGIGQDEFMLMMRIIFRGGGAPQSRACLTQQGQGSRGGFLETKIQMQRAEEIPATACPPCSFLMRVRFSWM